MKKLVSILLAICCVISCLGGCGARERNDEQSDQSKTELKVYCTSGGVGEEWLKRAEKFFEEKYAETKFEPDTDKVGVDIIVKSGRDTMTGNIKQQEYSVIFSEDVPTFSLSSSNSLLPITDIVTSSLSDVTDGKETVTIESKLSDSYKTSLTAIDGEYYMLPHFETYSGLSYNKKVFVDKSLYFKKGGGWTSVDSEKTVGPDGKANTHDDGLPSSMEEFYVLMDRMIERNVVPFIWMGRGGQYITRLLSGIDASLSGYDEYMLNYNFGKDGVVSSGSADIVTSFTGNKPNTEKVNITPANGYLMRQRESAYYALELLEKIYSSSNYYSEYIDENLTHLMAQGQFIYSDLQGKPIAMLMEGSYWYNEADDYLRRAESTYKIDRKDMQFEWMPLPVKVSGTVVEGEEHTQTLLSANNSYAFINANVKNDPNKEALAKTFFKYCYSNEMLVDFFLTTGLFKGVKTDVSGVDLSTIDHYKRSIAINVNNSKIATTISDNEITVRSLTLAFNEWGSTFKVDGANQSFLLPNSVFKSGKASAADYFKGMWLTNENWLSKYQDIINK